MRLGQLSRKLGTRSSEIVGFLQARGVVIEDSVNSKISDEESRIVAAHFAPQLKFDEPSAEEVVDIQIEEEPAMLEPQAPQEQLMSRQDEDGVILESSPADSAEPVQEPEVIKAPKVELQGLKVIGRIELPTPRKKEAPPATEDSIAEPTHNSEEKRSNNRRNSQHSNQKSATRPRKNPIAAQREREAREAEEKKKAELKREKETRTQYYLQKVKPSPPARKVSLVEEPLTQLHEEAPDEPKTLWGKFVKWLTSH